MTGSQALDCTLCPDPIAPGTNYAELAAGGTAHPWCWFQDRQRREARERAAHLPGCLCDNEVCPAPRTEVSGYVRRLRRAFRSTGPDGCVVWMRDAGQRAWGSPELFHSELASDPSRAFSDLPGHFGCLVAAQTPCVTADLGEADPDADMRQGFQGGYTCRLGHVHHGKSPYGRGDLPAQVLRVISASLGEESPENLPQGEPR
jgi:hypothetical protein